QALSATSGWLTRILISASRSSCRAARSVADARRGTSHMARMTAYVEHGWPALPYGNIRSLPSDTNSTCFSRPSYLTVPPCTPTLGEDRVLPERGTQTGAAEIV